MTEKITREQQVSIVAIASARAALYSIIVSNVPDSNYRKVALDRLEEAGMWAIAGITNLSSSALESFIMGRADNGDVANAT